MKLLTLHKQLVCLVIALVCLHHGFAQRQPTFEYWEGAWIQAATEKRLATGERWIRNSPTNWSGASYQLKNNDTLWQEKVQLLVGNDRTQYIVTATNAKGEPQGEPVTFTLTSFTPTKWVFENPTHDYPRRIVYERKKRNQLFAFIDEGGKGEQRVSFQYRREQK